MRSLGAIAIHLSQKFPNYSFVVSYVWMPDTVEIKAIEVLSSVMAIYTIPAKEILLRESNETLSEYLDGIGMEITYTIMEMKNGHQ